MPSMAHILVSTDEAEILDHSVIIIMTLNILLSWLHVQPTGTHKCVIHIWYIENKLTSELLVADY